MAKIVHGEDLDNRFLMFYLGSLFEQFKSSKTGSAIPHLDLAALRQQALPVPPMLEQNRIVAILEEVFDGIVIARVNAEKNLQNAWKLFESQRE